MTLPTFGQRLQTALREKGPLCVGIDPSAELLRAWELPDSAEGLRQFSSRVLEAVVGVVGVVKPQVAFFERHGSTGMAALEALLVQARTAGLLVLADAKRGDIGTTAAAYADAWLSPESPLCADAVTVTAYLGLEALQPLIDVGRRHGNGVIVVVRSSNPEGEALQSALVSDSLSVADSLFDAIAAFNARETAGAHLGTVGAVLGATVPHERAAALGGPILAPGLGAQGATGADFTRVFGSCPAGMVTGSVSRGVLAAGPDVHALRDAALRWQDSLR